MSVKINIFRHVNKNDSIDVIFAPSSMSLTRNFDVGYTTRNLFEKVADDKHKLKNTANLLLNIKAEVKTANKHQNDCVSDSTVRDSDDCSKNEINQNDAINDKDLFETNR